MRLLWLQSVICLYFVTTVVMTAKVPEYSKGSVTHVDAASSKRKFSVVLDPIQVEAKEAKEAKEAGIIGMRRREK